MASLIALALVGCGEESGGGAGGEAKAGTGGGGASGEGGTGGAGVGGSSGGQGGSGGGAAGVGGVAGVGASSGAGGRAGMAGTGGGAGSAGQGGGAGSAGQGGGAGAAGAPNPCMGPPPALKLTEVASGFNRPTRVVFSPVNPSVLYATEKWSQVGVWDGATHAKFLDLSSKVFGGGDAGVLGMAFHPQFGQGANRRFWVHYNRLADGASVVAQFAAPTDTNADESSESSLLVVPQPNDAHNGGMIEFGPDGYLYVSLGDGGPGNDTFGHGQNPATQLSAILRLDVDNYPTPPPGNMPGAHPDVYHYGLRNPWRFSFDRATGDLYIGDAGAKAWEEIDIAPAGGGHKNFGWSVFEGNDCFNAATCDPTGLTPPAIQHENPESSRAAIIGGYVYRGSAIPGLVGRYVYGDFEQNRVWTFTWDGSGTCDEFELTSELDPQGLIDGLVSFGEDASGELYVVSYWTGTIYRIEAE